MTNRTTRFLRAQGGPSSRLDVYLQGYGASLARTLRKHKLQKYVLRSIPPRTVSDLHRDQEGQFLQPSRVDTFLQEGTNRMLNCASDSFQDSALALRVRLHGTKCSCSRYAHFLIPHRTFIDCNDSQRQTHRRLPSRHRENDCSSTSVPLQLNIRRPYLP